jgi:hypothetical protein
MTCVDIIAHWRVTLNPEGAGLMLCIDRGIPCEGHTQVVSYHTTNTPAIETVEAVVGELRERFKGEIGAFVDFVRALKSAWELKEHVGLLFAHHVLGIIAEAAEKKGIGG